MAVAVPIIAGVAALTSATTSVVGGIKKGDAAQSAADYNASIANNNATLAVQQAAEDQRVYNLQANQQIGADRASLGASGIQSTSGSAVDVLRESASNAALDALKIQYGGAVKANAYQQNAYVATKTGQAASSGDYLSAAGTLLSAGAKGASYLSSSGGTAGSNGTLLGNYN